MGLPPKLARRLLVAPAVLIVGLVVLVASPVILLATSIVDLTLWRPLSTTRLVAVGLAQLEFEAFGVACLFGLWVISGFGATMQTPRMQDLHHRFVHGWLSGLFSIIGRLTGIVVEIEDAQPPRAGPVLVFSRHAGPWDSFLLAFTLVSGYDRRFRVVMKEAMQWFPVTDIVGNRLPSLFIRPGGKQAHSFIEQIENLAQGLGDHDALILFPEGGNFSEPKRLLAIGRLVDQGEMRRAEEARNLGNLIAPRPGGVLAALRGAPQAEPVFVAHTGLESLSSLRELWRRVPLRKPLAGRYWRLPRDQVPTDPDKQVDWLFGWWEGIDTWIEAHQRAAG